MEKLVLSSSTVIDKNQKLRLKDKLHSGVASVCLVSDAAATADLLSTWPPKHYTCSFCDRRFKSAQALGGHMNVHRREKVMLKSKSISPISLPPLASTWLPSISITTAPHPLQNDESHFIIPNSNLKHPSIIPKHTRKHIFPCISHLLPMHSVTSPSTWRHTNSLPEAATAYKNAPVGQYHHFMQVSGVTPKKNFIRAVEKLNGLYSSNKNAHSDDALVKLSLGNGHLILTDRQDIDLELRL